MDFNEFTGDHEKTGGNLGLAASFVSFNLMIRYCGMLKTFHLMGINCHSEVVENKSLNVHLIGLSEMKISMIYSLILDYLGMIGSDQKPILVNYSNSIGRKSRCYWDQLSW